MNWIDIVGYSGSLLVALSLMMKNIRRLRQINLIGASTFAFYGFLVNAYPVLLLNSFIALTDIYYLIDMYKTTEYFTLMPVLDKSHRYLDKFFKFYEDDIKKFFPDFDIEQITNCNCFFILRNLMPVGLFVYEKISDNEIKIHLDYAIPDYRDLKNARFIYFAETRHFKEQLIKTLYAESKVKQHAKYLKNIGFEPVSGKQNLYLKTLD